MNSAKSKQKLPTVQEQVEDLKANLMELNESVTRPIIDQVSRKLDVHPDTTVRYLKGEIGKRMLKRGRKLYNELLKEMEKSIAA